MSRILLKFITRNKITLTVSCDHKQHIVDKLTLAESPPDKVFRQKTINELLNELPWIPGDLRKFFISTGCDSVDDRITASEALKLLKKMRARGICRGMHE